ncbi:unnamed protein product [Arctogadus glacialis]
MSSDRNTERTDEGPPIMQTMLSRGPTTIARADTIQKTKTPRAAKERIGGSQRANQRLGTVKELRRGAACWLRVRGRSLMAGSSTHCPEALPRGREREGPAPLGVNGSLSVSVSASAK